MKKVFFISLLSIQCLNLQSQTLNWVNPTGGSGSDFGNSITVDSLGNVYNVGEFQNSSDFDSGDEIYYMSSAGNFDAFITKTNSQGDLIWAKRIGGINYDSGNGITIDDSGYVYVTGAFNGVVDFNPGAGIYNVNGGSGSTFLLKLNSYGNFIWVKSFNAIGFSSYSHGLSIAFDLFNNIIISGELNGGADMDPGVGSHSLFSSGDEDVYVCKLNYQGDFIWAVKIGGGGIERAGYVTTNSMGDIFVSGAFEGTADFDPGVGVYNLVAIGSGWLDGFFMKLDSSGNFQWANKIGDAYDDYTNSIALDTNENVIVSGSFDGTVDFDPGPSTFALSTTPYYNGLC
jgi:hypothetical protein